jgi:hypothetical protein
VNDLAGHVLEVLREDDEFTLLRGHRLSDSRPILAVASRYGSRSGASLKRLENEYAIAGELEPAWAVRPLDLLRRNGGATLILEDPGSYRLDTRLGSAFEMTAFLRIHAKTGGNPFFVIQFLSSLEHEGLLAFAIGKASWAWNVEEIVAKGFTENVVALMVARLSRLPENVQNALKQLACLGNIGRVATLAAVYGETRETLDAALWEAVHVEFVSSNDDAYSFVHDRIQEAAYLLIPETERAPIFFA